MTTIYELTEECIVTRADGTKVTVGPRFETVIAASFEDAIKKMGLLSDFTACTADEGMEASTFIQCSDGKTKRWYQHIRRV